MERQKVLIQLLREILVAIAVACIIYVLVLFVSGQQFSVSAGISFVLRACCCWWILFRVPAVLLRRWWKKRSAVREVSRVATRFLMNRNALFGALVLLYTSIIFTGAHLLAPDGSSHAAQQVNELAFCPPGTEAVLFSLPHVKHTHRESFLKVLLRGRDLQERLIAVTDARADTSGVYVTRFMGDGIIGPEMSYRWEELGLLEPEDDAAAESKLKDLLIHRTYHLGTDDLGRDYLSRLIVGVRVSFAVGFVAVFIALLIGIPVGAVAGYYQQHPPVIHLGKRRWKLPADGFIMWTMSVVWAIPTLLLVFPVVYAFGQQFYTIFIAVGITMWVDIARVVRGQVMQVRELEFIEATRSFGYGKMRTILLHILPNITGPVIVITAANFAYAILTESGLSFLGIGVQPPAPSWGLMISKYKDNLITDPYLALLPGAAITLLVLAFFLVGNGLRDAMDIRMQES